MRLELGKAERKKSAEAVGTRVKVQGMGRMDTLKLEMTRGERAGVMGIKDEVRREGNPGGWLDKGMKAAEVVSSIVTGRSGKNG